jgi:outer membrane lipoprotein-sorting protein
MISGGRPGARLGAALCAAALAAAGAMGAEPAAPGAWDLKRLMHELSQVKSTKARFSERKDVAILSAPLESSGTLLYTAPDKLEKHTLAPRAESLVLDGDRLTLENKARNQRRTFALRDQPEIGAFVESIRSTLAGDLATLSRYYQVALDGAQGRWRLTLKPIEPAMQRVVSEIRLDGGGSSISSIEITETNGDRSVMTITPEKP